MSAPSKYRSLDLPGSVRISGIPNGSDFRIPLEGGSKIGPQQRRNDLKKRTAHLLQMLVANKNNAVGLSQSTVANAMQEQLDVLGIQVKDCYETLRNYVKGTRAPQASHAWALGEGLREAGVPWMNGFCMLWAAGAYEESLATAFEYVVQHGNALNSDEVQMLWYGTKSGMLLPQYRSVFDFEPEVLRHLNNGASVEAFLESKVAASSPESLTIDSVNFDADAYERDLEATTISVRDFAIARWRQVVPFMESLTAAYVSANIRTDTPYRPRHASVANDFWGTHSGADSLVTVALDLARSSYMPVGSLEISILIVLGQYLNMLDPDLNNGGRSMTHLPRDPGI